MLIGAPNMSRPAIQFFAMFSRIEYAMKRCDAYRTLIINKKKPHRSWLQADWSKLATSSNIQNLWPQLEQDLNAQEIIKSPPRLLTLKGQSVEFGDQPPPCTDVGEMFIAMKDVRNNLFHGEKGNASQPREVELLGAGLYIMDKILEVEPEILANYWF